MSTLEQLPYVEPFDIIADDYDQVFTFSKIGQAQRNCVWQELQRVFRSGQHVLDIGCGTGVDACFLADRGVRVTACDSSNRMIEVTRRHAQASAAQNLVLARVIRAEDIGHLASSRVFDGALSNFGALNCVENLPDFAQNVAALLKPQATALLCFMGRFCVWEMAAYFAQMQPAKALRRWCNSPVAGHVGRGARISVYYSSLRQLVRAFQPHFRLRSIKGIGVALPPSYLEPWVTRHPRLLRFAVSADRLLSRLPGIRVLADHILLELECGCDE